MHIHTHIYIYKHILMNCTPPLSFFFKCRWKSCKEIGWQDQLLCLLGSLLTASCLKSRLPIFPGHVISQLFTWWAAGLPGSPTGCSTSSPAGVGVTWCHRNQALLLECALAGVWKKICFVNSKMFRVFWQPGQHLHFTALKRVSIKICSVTVTILVSLFLPCWFSFKSC